MNPHSSHFNHFTAGTTFLARRFLLGGKVSADVVLLVSASRVELVERAAHGVPTSFEPHLPGGTKATLLIEPRNTRARGLRGHRLRLSVDPRIPLDK